VGCFILHSVVAAASFGIVTAIKLAFAVRVGVQRLLLKRSRSAEEGEGANEEGE